MIHGQPSSENRRLLALDVSVRDDGLALAVREPHGRIRWATGRAAWEEVHRALASGGPAVVGLDAPLGVPRAWARRLGIAGFRELLCRPSPHLRRAFFTPARTLAEVRPERPFLMAGRGVRRTVWHARLGLAGPAAVSRRCDRRARAHPLFWCVGPRQVGRAALRVWTELLRPFWCPRRIPIWPFDGSLAALLAGGRPVVAEIYPSLMRRTFARGGQVRAARLLGEAWAARLAAVAAGARARTHLDDAAFGLLVLAAAVAAPRRVRLPADPAVHRLEGWILGLPPAGHGPVGDGGTGTDGG